MKSRTGICSEALTEAPFCARARSRPFACKEEMQGSDVTLRATQTVARNTTSAGHGTSAVHPGIAEPIARVAATGGVTSIGAEELPRTPGRAGPSRDGVAALRRRRRGAVQAAEPLPLG